MTDIELVTMIAQGMASKEIAYVTKYAETSIESFRSRMFKRYKVRNAAQLVSLFYETGKLKPLNGNEKQGNQTYEIGQARQLWEYDICR